METLTTFPGGEFVTLEEVRSRLGMHRVTLQRRLRRAGIRVFVHPADERARLIRREDAEAMFRPRPVEDRPPTSAAGTAA